MSRTVHEIPLLLKPFFLIASAILAWVFMLPSIFFRLFCRFEYVGVENLEQYPNQIFSIWHENLPFFFMTHPRWTKPNIWITFPLWYMKPIHMIKKWMGIKELAYGASGHQGKMALEKILKRLREGWSTFLTPDGPKGPTKVLKDGVLLMSLKTGVPVIPVSFQIKREWRIPSWDRKRYPKFGATLKVIYNAPIVVTESNFEEARAIIAKAMNDPAEEMKGQLKRPSL
jgi:hypothetical protein